MIEIKFDSWEDFDNKLGSLAVALYKASKEEELLECARCGELVLPSEHPEIGCDI